MLDGTSVRQRVRVLPTSLSSKMKIAKYGAWKSPGTGSLFYSLRFGVQEIHDLSPQPFDLGQAHLHIIMLGGMALNRFEQSKCITMA